MEETPVQPTDPVVVLSRVSHRAARMTRVEDQSIVFAADPFCDRLFRRIRHGGYAVIPLAMIALKFSLEVDRPMPFQITVALFGLAGFLIALSFILNKTVSRWIEYRGDDQSIRAGWRWLILEGERQLAGPGEVKFLTVGPGFAPSRETLYAIWARVGNGLEVPLCDFRTPFYDKAVQAVRELAPLLGLSADEQM